MNKKSHMIFTEQMNTMMPATCSRFLQAGCILPDILVHTYLVGHTWDSSGEKTLKNLEKLANGAELNVWSSLRLGMMLHYLEDYFTMAHNKAFQGNIREHVQYETKLMSYLIDYFQSEKSEDYSDFSPIRIQSAEELADFIVQLQYAYQQETEDYLKEEKNVNNENQSLETDLKYMKLAVQSVLNYTVPVMYEKTITYRQLVGEAMNKMPQGYGTM